MAVANFRDKMPLDQIDIKRDERQRRTITDVDKLAKSIQEIGLLHPIVIQREGKVLLVGERRLTAFKHLRDTHPLGAENKENPWFSIPFRYFDTLTSDEAQLVELEENVQRVELPWQERVEATAKIHDILCLRDTNHTVAGTSRRLNISPDTAARHIMVAQAIRDGNQLVTAAATLSEAYNKLQRALDRTLAGQMENLMAGSMGISGILQAAVSAPAGVSGGDAGGAKTTPARPLGTPHNGPTDPAAPPHAPGAVTPVTRPPVIVPAGPPFVNTDFLEWADSYTGPRFNFLHCDFPYGIDHQKSAQGRVAEYGEYADQEDVYWKLLEGLARNKQKLLFDSAHIMFWFSMNFYPETMAFFEKHFPEFTFDPFPLIWWKDRGIAPDVERRPRRVYETALVGFSGNRKLVSCRGNLIQAACGNKIHASEKSAEMLRGFFRLFVDQNTKMLDPTCGSGTSVRAAKSLGAQQVLGIEKHTPFFQEAVTAYQMAAALGFPNIKGADDEQG